jgi:hypothetical protein
MAVVVSDEGQVGRSRRYSGIAVQRHAGGDQNHFRCGCDQGELPKAERELGKEPVDSMEDAFSAKHNAFDPAMARRIGSWSRVIADPLSCRPADLMSANLLTC